MIGRDIQALDPNEKGYTQTIYDLVDRLKETAWSCCPDTTNPTPLKRIDLTKLSFEEFDSFHYHWTLSKNIENIAKLGLMSSIGRNSAQIDNDEAIYVSKGVLGVINCNDIWTKWRYNSLFSPFAAQYPFRLHRKLTHEEQRAISRYSNSISESFTTGRYLEDDEKLDAVFYYQLCEQRASKYLAVSLKPGVDYNRKAYDRKKTTATFIDYARVIYGDGVSTDFTNEYAEDWNIFTPLGVRKVVDPSRLALLTVGEKDDMASVLAFIYNAYLVNCIKTNSEPLYLPTLAKYNSYYRKHA